MSIQITEKAFKRMMVDKDFKDEMMTIMKKESIACKSPIVSSMTIIDENGYKGVTYNDYNMSKNVFNAHSKNKDSFYVKKFDKKYMDKKLDKARERKKLEQKELLKGQIKRDISNQRYFHDLDMKEQLKHIRQVESLNQASYVSEVYDNMVINSQVNIFL